VDHVGVCWHSGAMTEMTALETVRATADPIHDIGTMIYMSPETFARAAEWGWQNPFGFYAAGRGAVLGDVGSDIVASTFGWFEPSVVGTLWADGVGVHGTAVAAERMAEATAMWGRDHFAGASGLAGFVSSADALVDGVSGAALPLFEGWRRLPRPSDDAGRAGVLMQTLREWRGAVHLVATTAVGLSPLEAILSRDGEGQAKMLGWAEPFADCSSLKAARDEAEEMTDRLCAADVERALTPAQRADFVDGVAGLRKACG
jgi:hypothetical protein